jgi:PAS domain S-box-containing protein
LGYSFSDGWGPRGPAGGVASGRGGEAITTYAQREAAELLIDAGAVLASSLDVSTTISQVARLTVPALADMCVIDLRDEDGSLRECAVAASDPGAARALEALRRRYPLDPEGPHPVAHVLRYGEPLLLPEMTSMLLEAFATGSEHARFMVDRDYRSAIVAPLVARDRTLGTLSVLRLGSGELYGQEQLDLACELARRAALAIDNARLFSEVRGLERRLEAILANLAEAITVIDGSGRTVFANQAAADLLLVGSPAELVGGEPGSVAERFVMLDEQGRELTLDELPARRLLAGETAEELLVRNVVRATGEERWLNVRSTPIYDPDTGAIQYAVNVFENITDFKRAQLAESFMAQASRVLASSLDFPAVVQRLARLAVPQLADWCAIDLLDDDGSIQRALVHHEDAEKRALAEQFERDRMMDPSDAAGVAAVLRSGEPRLLTDLEATGSPACDDGGLLRAIGARAAMIVPLVGTLTQEDGTIGAMTLVAAESRRHFDAADLALARRLGRRGGAALENARLYTERSRIAHVLQRALLPESLPTIPGAQLAARYLAAGALNEVGGDFYDVFADGTDRYVLMIGDVVGKGPRAAGVTALARHTLRAAAISGRPTPEMLELVHRALRAQPAGADMCTVCLADVRGSDEGLHATVTLAGHPPALLVRADGSVEAVGQPGTLLGVFDPINVCEQRTVLREGDTLLLYTDGVLDAGRGNDGGDDAATAADPLGEEGLRRLCASTHSLPLRDMLAAVEREATTRAREALRDDVALLAIRVGAVGAATNA